MHTALQSALWMVAAYPTVLNFTVFEALAEMHGQPSNTDLMKQQQPRDQVLTWDDVVTYVQSITTSNVFCYIPLVSRLTRQAVPNSMLKVT